MKRQEYINYIIEKLSSFETEVKLSGKINLTDSHNHAEYFFRDLFNLIFDNANFENLNAKKINASAIDLIDEKQKRIIQVSGSATKEKITDTLSKNIIEDYAQQNYKLEFLFIQIDCEKLKKSDYKNHYKIIFNPNDSIWSLSDLTKKIQDLKIEILEKVFDLFKKEFPSRKEIILSELSQIVFILYEKNSLNKLDDNFDLNQFKIQAKIQFNDLEKIKDVYINPNAVYFGYIEKIYQQFDQQGHDKRLAIYSKLTEFYYQQTKNLEIDNVEKFENIIKSVKNQVLDSSNYPKEISVERLELYCKIIVVHAFIECKIFEKPEKSNTIALYLEEEEYYEN